MYVSYTGTSVRILYGWRWLQAAASMQQDAPAEAYTTHSAHPIFAAHVLSFVCGLYLLLQSIAGIKKRLH